MNNLPAKLARFAEAIALEYSENATPLHQIVKEEELDLYYDYYGVNEFDGMTVYSDGYFSIHINIDNGNKIDSGRGRFTLAHELAHYLIDNHRIGLQNGILKPHPSFTNKDFYNAIEKEADYFASCLLMPKLKFDQFVVRKKFNFELINDITEAFNVSVTAATLRFAEIGSHPILIVYVEDGFIKWTRKSNNFPFFKTLSWPRVPINSVTSEYFRRINLGLVSSAEEVWAIDWFENVANWDVQRKFYEYCIPYKNKALTIIWEK